MGRSSRKLGRNSGELGRARESSGERGKAQEKLGRARESMGELGRGQGQLGRVQETSTQIGRSVGRMEMLGKNLGRDLESNISKGNVKGPLGPLYEQEESTREERTHVASPVPAKRKVSPLTPPLNQVVVFLIGLLSAISNHPRRASIEYRTRCTPSRTTHMLFDHPSA